MCHLLIRPGRCWGDIRSSLVNATSRKTRIPISSVKCYRRPKKMHMFGTEAAEWYVDL